MKRFQNILYLNEPTVDQTSAVARAVSLAENNQADLTIVDVIPNEVVTAGIGLPPGGPISRELQAALESDRRKDMEALAQPFSDRLQIRLNVLIGKTYLETIRAVLKNEYDLLIKPAESPDWTHGLFGSDDLHLLRKCPCPVWLMKPPEKTNYSSIMAAVEFDLFSPLPAEHDLNRRILELAASLALSDFASMNIVHAWEARAEKTAVYRDDMFPESLNNSVDTERERHRKELCLLVEKLQEWIGKDACDYLSPGVHLPKGPAKKVIAPFASVLGADLVVMGTVIRTGIPGVIIGNTAEAIINQLTCSVLAIKPPGFKTPVKIEP